MPGIVGRDCKLYRNTGNFGTPVWDEVTIVSDVTLNGSVDSADAATRESIVKKMIPTMVDASITAKLRSDLNTNADYAAFRTAFLGRSSIDVMCLNGDSATNGVVGMRYEAFVSDFTRDEPLNGAVFHNMVLMPDARSSNTIQSVVVASSTPAFTNI